MTRPELKPILTEKQNEYLIRIGNGKTRSEIAAEFHISPYSVDAALKDARVRLQTRTVPQTILRAIAWELLLLGHDGEVAIPKHVNAKMIAFQ